MRHFRFKFYELPSSLSEDDAGMKTCGVTVILKKLVRLLQGLCDINGYISRSEFLSVSDDSKVSSLLLVCSHTENTSRTLWFHLLTLILGC